MRVRVPASGSGWLPTDLWVLWAIREGRQCAQAVDAYLMGASKLPR